MALRAMYKGIKKVLAPLIINRPGELAIDQDALVADLNPVFFPRSEQAVLGAVNFCENKAVTQTIENATFTVATDGTITINRSESGGQAQLAINSALTLKAGTYKLCGFPSVMGELGQLHVYKSPDYLAIDTGNGASFTLASDTTVIVVLRLNNTKLVTNLIVKPMITLDANATYSDFAPYAMTNKQLTDAVVTLNGSASDQKTAINAIITAATGAADFAAFKAAMSAITPVTRSIQVTPETREEITDPEEEPVKKTTRKKSTAKADTEKEGE